MTDYLIDAPGEDGLCSSWCVDCGHTHAHGYDGVCFIGRCGPPFVVCPCPYRHGIPTMAYRLLPGPDLHSNSTCPTTGLYHYSCQCNRHRCGRCGRRTSQQERRAGQCRCVWATSQRSETTV